jgi:hypothetical protein
MQEIMYPADSFTITLKDAEIDLIDGRDRKQIFFTDGRKLQKSKDADHQEFIAKWDDNRMVSEEKGANGGKIIRSFEVSADGRSLFETVRTDGGRSGGSIYLRYVYDFDGGEKQ